MNTVIHMQHWALMKSLERRKALISALSMSLLNLFLYLFISVSLCLFMNAFIYLSIHPSTYLFINLSVPVRVFLFLCSPPMYRLTVCNNTTTALQWLSASKVIIITSCYTTIYREFCTVELTSGLGLIFPTLTSPSSADSNKT